MEKKYRLPRRLKKKYSKDIILSVRLPKNRKRIKAMLEYPNTRILMNLLVKREENNVTEL
jgi:hypothetical protein